MCFLHVKESEFSTEGNLGATVNKHTHQGTHITAGFTLGLKIWRKFKPLYGIAPS
jgi:hypothetical protein